MPDVDLDELRPEVFFTVSTAEEHKFLIAACSQGLSRGLIAVVAAHHGEVQILSNGLLSVRRSSALVCRRVK